MLLSLLLHRAFPCWTLLAMGLTAAPSWAHPHPPPYPPVEAASATAPGDPLAVWAESLARRFATCFTPFGARPGFPVAAREPAPREVIAQAVLPASALVSDGYRHELRVHGPSNAVFIVQSGGLAGTRTVFGPLAVDTVCAESGSEPFKPASRPR
jgi:hypothetical protein